MFNTSIIKNIQLPFHHNEQDKVVPEMRHVELIEDMMRIDPDLNELPCFLTHLLQFPCKIHKYKKIFLFVKGKLKRKNIHDNFL